MDRKFFFDGVRGKLFAGNMTQGQVDGCEAILGQWEKRHPKGDPRWLAYMLATGYHETDRKMQPIAEYGHGKGLAYGEPDPVTGHVYYGRGLVQLTWKANYKTMGDRLGHDLVNNPDLALDPKVSADIMFEGMENGLFTGVGLSRYFGASSDPRNARRIINGLDRADMVAGYYAGFLAALVPPASS